MRKKILFAVLTALLCIPLTKADEPIVLDGYSLTMLPTHFSRNTETMFQLYNEVYNGNNDYDEYTILDENFNAVTQFDTKGKRLYYLYCHTTAGVQSETFAGLYGLCGKEFVYVKSIEVNDSYGSDVSIGCVFINPKNDTEAGKISFPHGWYAVDRYMHVYVPNEMEDKMYITIRVTKGGDECALLVYTTDGTSAGIKQVAMMPVSKVSPTAPRRGEKVTVTLDEEMAAQGAEVRVVGSDGQVMMNTKIAVGQTTLDIPTNRLKQGVYVVTVGDKEATKIVIR